MSLFDSELANTQISSLSQLPTESSPLDFKNLQEFPTIWIKICSKRASNKQLRVFPFLSTLFMAFWSNLFQLYVSKKWALIEKNDKFRNLTFLHKKWEKVKKSPPFCTDDRKGKSKKIKVSFKHKNCLLTLLHILWWYLEAVIKSYRDFAVLLRCSLHPERWHFIDDSEYHLCRLLMVKNQQALRKRKRILQRLLNLCKR